MKLLFVIKTLAPAGGAGGAERVLTDVASALAARRHDVTIASFDRDGDQDFYPPDPAVRRVRLAVGVANAKTRPSELVGRVRRLRSITQSLRPDVAIGFMHSAYVPLAIALAGMRTATIASEHIVYGHYRDRPVERLLLNLLPSRFDAITAISEAVRGSFPAAIAKRMVALPNPVAEPAGNPANPVGGERKILLTVGRLFAQKDHKTLVAAFARLADLFPDWTLRIVGEGELRKPLEAQVAALGLGSRIQMPGKRADIAREYEAAQLFVMPSSYESFGLATAEALAHGLPAIGFADCPGTNELIVDGVNGLLARGPDRTAALAETMARAMGSPELRARLGGQGPASVERFSLDAVCDQWEALLQRVSRGQPEPVAAAAA